ncbi:MAG: hypothetical protein JWM85_258 [Acidimicrobiaceae bacterium]|nr:hypothetical protein [Acidimicrobiaceae bacterium]
MCFVRHGVTPTTGKILPGRAKGLHLSEQGRLEAGRAGERLAALKVVSAIYTSPLERAQETAAEIGQHLGLRPKVERGLMECDFGDWTGLELAALRKLPEWNLVLNHPAGFRFPNVESFLEMRARLAAAVERLTLRHPGEVIVAVSHADPIKITVGDAGGVPLDLVQRSLISTCSVSVVAYGAGLWGCPMVLTVNSTGDLGQLGIAKPAAPAQSGRRR